MTSDAGDVGGWVLETNVRPFLELVATAVGYDFTETDWCAFAAGLPATDAGKDDSWFTYPFSHDESVIVAVAEHPGSAVTSFRVYGRVDYATAVRVEAYADVLSSYPVEVPELREWP